MQHAVNLCGSGILAGVYLAGRNAGPTCFAIMPAGSVLTILPSSRKVTGRLSLLARRSAAAEKRQLTMTDCHRWRLHHAGSARPAPLAHGCRFGYLFVVRLAVGRHRSVGNVAESFRSGWLLSQPSRRPGPLAARAADRNA